MTDSIITPAVSSITPAEFGTIVNGTAAFTTGLLVAAMYGERLTCGKALFHIALWVAGASAFAYLGGA